MKEKILRDYLIKEKVDIDKIIDDFYSYIYMIIKNSVSIYVSDEDIEEIISDVFVAMWKNSRNLSRTTIIRPYLIGITKNVIKNKYRTTECNLPIFDYENNFIGNEDVEIIIENMEKESIINNSIKKLKQEEYQTFIMFYYEQKSIKEISSKLKCSDSKVKTILHKVRKILRKNLNDGGYGYGK